MSAPLSIYFFGDQSTLSKDDLGALLLKGGNKNLNSLADQASFLLRKEIQSLSWSQREQFPAFANFQDLVTLDASKPLHQALQSALSCVHHFALYFCQRSSELDSSSPSNVSHTIGFGTGLLAAIAVNCCPTPDQLLPIALQTILVSFRVGLLASNVRDQIFFDKDVSASWSMRVEPSKTENVHDQLDEFASQKRLSKWSKPYVCGALHNSLLIGGIPALLHEFVNSHKLNASVLPVYAPFHNPDIFSETDIEQVLHAFPETIEHLIPKSLLFPQVGGKSATPQTLKFLLRVAVKAILQEPLASDGILQYVKEIVQSQPAQSCTVVSIGIPRGSKDAINLQGSEFLWASKVNHVDDAAIMQLASGFKNARQSKLAITGFSGRFPEAENIHAFWDVIHGGIDTHSETPKTRWDVKSHVDSSLKRKNTSATPYGCWLKNPGLFDRSFFSISPREAPQMDPAQRIALMCAYEALEMAGIVPDASPSTMRSRVGVFIGCTSNDWCETNSAQDVDFYFIPGGNRAFIPGRINYCFKFSGPSFSVDTACSSSLAAMHVACNALWRGEVDTAIVGGTNILTNPDVTAGLDRGHFLSRTGNCKSFDDGADGYCRGEGVGIVVLKRLEDAQAENDSIYGCVLSAVTNHSAEAESITRPHVGAQQTVFSQVLTKGGVHPNDIDYVEMHGTGTQAGDGREMLSVTQTFTPFSPDDQRSRNSDLYIGSVKSNIGHGEAVSGVSALIKVLLMLQKNEIPPHCGIKTKINRTFPSDLEARRIKIAKQAIPWTKSGRPRRVLINNFSAAGGNTSILVEDAPTPVLNKDRPDTRPSHVVIVSAKTQTALQSNICSLARFLQVSSSVSLPDLAYTTSARRAHYNFRASYVAQNTGELSKVLEHDTAHAPQQVRGPPKIILAFSGQGSGHAGMGKYLYDTNTAFRIDLNRFDAIVQGQGFGSILPYIRGTQEPMQQPSPMTTQLAQLSIQMALARLWRSWGVVPVAVVGHSLGEYAALHYAGILSDFDVLWICGQRVKLLATHCWTGTHAMLAVRSSEPEVVASLRGIPVEVACINGPHEIVVGGTIEDVEASARRLQAKGITCHQLNVPYAFHSGQLEPILENFSRVLDGLTIRPAAIPVLSTVLSTVVKIGDEIDSNYLVRHSREAVNLVGAVRAAEAASLLDDRTHVIEVGPGQVLARLIQRTVERPLTIMPSLEPNQDSWRVLARSVASAYRVGCNINWIQYHRDYDHSVVQLPQYSWDLKNYWLQYVNDWSLRKGDPLPAITPSSAESRLETTTSCQKVVFADFKGDAVHVVMESDLQSESLKPVVAGHRVNGIAVCIGAVYADMAMSCAQSILKCLRSDAIETTTVIRDLDMQEALIINDTPEPQVVKIEAKCTKDQSRVHVEISTPATKKVHAKATIEFVNSQKEQQNLTSGKASTSSQIESLKSRVASGLAERYTTSMAYRMVASLAHYDASHKGVKDCSLDSTSLEASAIVASAPPHRLPGNFALHPCVFDAIMQLATFVLNANENSRFDQEVYVVRGFESLFVNQVLSTADEYETFVKMNASDKDNSVGDVVIMKNKGLIGCIKGVRVQRVPRRLMDVMFRPKVDVATKQKSPKPTTPSKLPPIQVQPTAPAKVDTQKMDKAFAIISEESGIAVSDFKDEDLLSDLGIDSLLILVIASRFREELELDLDATFFADVDSVGKIRAHFGNQGSIVPVSVPVFQDAIPSSNHEEVVAPVDPSKLENAFSIISEESGIAVTDFKNDDLLADLGIDSLLILVIASRFREELELDLDATFFAEVDSIAKIRAFFQPKPPATPIFEDRRGSSSASSGTSSPKSFASSTTAASFMDGPDLTKVQPEVKPQRTIPKKVAKSTSIILQGTMKPTTKTMFMFPDGSGSATSYMHLPRVHEDVAIVAMNCPYMTNPNEWEGDFLDITRILLAEVRRRQPKGPYYLGGWSAGGAFAYCATQMLLEAGEEVKSLVLIDAPCPIGLGKLPQAFFDYWRTIHQPGGMVEDRPLPSWLMDHFKAVNENLRGFVANPMPRGKTPKTYMVWAAKGTDNLAAFPGRHLLTQAESDDLGFLMDDKTDFESRGWDKLLLGEDPTVEVAWSSNHFTITRGDGAKLVSSLVKRACLDQA